MTANDRAKQLVEDFYLRRLPLNIEALVAGLEVAFREAVIEERRDCAAVAEAEQAKQKERAATPISPDGEVRCEEDATLAVGRASTAGYIASLIHGRPMP